MKWMLIAVAFAGALPAATIGIDPAITNTLQGTSFTVDLTIASVVDLYAFQVDIGFSPAVLSATGVTAGSFLGGGAFLPGIIDNSAGTITFIADSLTGLVPGISGSGTLATIQFLALAAGSSSIAPSNAILLDSGFNDIPYSAVNGTANVTTGGAEIPEPNTAVLVCAALTLVLWRVSARGARR
jgi:hypothetical protein